MGKNSELTWQADIYEAWYHSRRGQWIAHAEFALLQHMLRLSPGASILDVGCGTGYFSHCFMKTGHPVTCMDRDEAMLDYASNKRVGGMHLVHGDALTLPFADRSFDHCIAVTSLCFILEPQRALVEMMRVSRKSIMLGLLNRNSLLFRQKHGHGSYRNARWDRRSDVQCWANELGIRAEICSAIFVPSGGAISRIVENIVPASFPFGGFLAAKITLV